MQARVIVSMALIWLCIVALGPTCKGDTWDQKGDGSFKNGSYEFAILCYDKATEMNSSDSYAWSQKGRALYRLEKYNESITCYDKVINIDPLSDSAWYTKGLALYNMGKYAESLQAFNTSIEIDPNYAWPWYGKGLIFYKMGEFNDSVQAYNVALDKNENQVDMSYFLEAKEKALSSSNYKKYIFLILNLLILISFLLYYLGRLIRGAKSRSISVDNKERCVGFKNVQVVNNRIVRLMLRFMPLVVSLLFLYTVYLQPSSLFSYSIWSLLPSTIVFFIAFFIFRVLESHVSITLGDLYKSGIVAIKQPIIPVDEQQTKDKLNLTNDSLEAQQLEEQYDKFIRDFEGLLNHPIQYALGIIFAFVGWIGLYGFMAGVIPVVNSSNTNSSFILSWAIAQLTIGFVIGLMVWRMLVVSVQLWRFGKIFDVAPHLGHPDKCGELAPIGNLCLWNSIFAFIPGIYIWGWMLAIIVILYPGFDIDIPDAKIKIARELMAILVPITTMILIFLFPQWNFHKILVYKRAIAWKQLSEKVRNINNLAYDVLTKGNEMKPDEIDAITKGYELMQNIYEDRMNMNFPTWTFSLGTLTKFATVLITVIPLVTFFMDVFRRI